MDSLIQMSRFVNQRLDEGDVVLSTSHVLRHVDATAYLFPQAIVRDGCEIMTYSPDYIPQSRFKEDCMLTSAKFIIMQAGNNQWVRAKNCTKINNELDKWIMVNKTSRYEVYENPRFIR